MPKDRHLPESLSYTSFRRFGFILPGLIANRLK